MRFPNFKGSKGHFKCVKPEGNGVYLVTSKDGVVFIVHGDGQAEANAKLGAASKQLLNACIHALKVFEENGIEKPDFLIRAIKKAL